MATPTSYPSYLIPATLTTIPLPTKVGVYCSKQGKLGWV